MKEDNEAVIKALKEIHARYCIPASKQNYTDKDYACMQYEKLVIHLQKEIERLNNIINELEKYLNEQVDYMTHHSIERMIAFDCCRHRLQELKGSDK